MTVVLLSSIQGSVTLEMRALPRMHNPGDLPDFPLHPPPASIPDVQGAVKILLSQTNQMQTFPHLFLEVEQC